MSETLAAPETVTPHSAGRLEVASVIGAAVLVGLGLTALAFYLITFHWLFLAGVIPLAGGGLLLFSRWTGPDHA